MVITVFGWGEKEDVYFREVFISDIYRLLADSESVRVAFVAKTTLPRIESD